MDIPYKAKYIKYKAKYLELKGGDLFNHPKDFFSTNTYQNQKYKFPHRKTFWTSYDELKLLFFSEDYFLGNYASYRKPDCDSVCQNDTIQKLQQIEIFSYLGVGYMRLKGLLEEIDAGLFDKLRKIITNEKIINKLYNNKMYNMDFLYDDILNNDYLNQLKLDIEIITNIIQICIINIVDYVVKNKKEPDIFNNSFFKKIKYDLKKFCVYHFPNSASDGNNILYLFYYSHMHEYIVGLTSHINKFNEHKLLYNLEE